MPLFLLADTIGDLLYVALPVLLGQLFHGAVDSVLAVLVQLGEAGLALVFGLFALYVLARWAERRAFARRLRIDRISVDELGRLIDGGNAPLIFDVRERVERERNGQIPGAVGAHSSDITVVLDTYPRESEIVIYCSCPNEASAAIAALHLKRAGFTRIRPLLGGIEAWAKAGRPVVAGT